MRTVLEPRTVAHNRLTAGLAMWNMGVAYLVGLLLAIACERKWVTL